MIWRLQNVLEKLLQLIIQQQRDIVVWTGFHEPNVTLMLVPVKKGGRSPESSKFIL